MLEAAPGALQTGRAELPPDNVQAYIPSDRRRALAAGRELPADVEGGALFADISGFTRLTEALVLELGAQRGAEELTATLDSVVGALLAVLEQHGGTAIYFSGDAVTCWLDGDDGLRATACGFAMQSVMDQVGRRSTPGGRAVRLQLKVAVAVGAAHRFVVGDADVQLIDVLAGSLMDSLAAAEREARPGEVVLSACARRSLGDRVLLAAARGHSAVATGLRVPVAYLAPLPLPPPLPDDVVRQWLLPAVYERLSAGHGEFLAELRPAVPLFLRFGGMDFDTDPSARDQLDAFVRRAQRVVDANGGNVMQLTIGDKGAYLYAVFGAPVAHEDDAARACTSALELLELDSCTAATGLQVGVAAGRLRSGTYGHRERRTFCCLGDAVNLAARLMAAAPAGSAYVAPEVRRAAGDGFAWGELPMLRVKGKAQGIAVSALRGAQRPDSRALSTRHAMPMVGRDAELTRLSALAHAALSGQGQLVVLTGEAGVGKSRLVTALTAGLAGQGVTLYAGTAPAYGVRSSYGAWQDVWRSIWEVAPDAPPDAVVERLQEVLTATDPALLPRLPLLGEVLGVPLPDSALTATFDAKLRKTSLESLVVQYLEASGRALALTFEDSHWLDPLSVDLLEAVARAAPRLPLLLLLVRRPPPEGRELGLLSLPHVQELVLGELEPNAARSLALTRVRALSDGVHEVPEPLLERLVTRAQGNPFHLEELLSHLVDRGLDPRDPQALDLELPTSLHSLVLTRIDDLAEQPRRTLKVASVVGRRFAAPVLSGAYPDLGGRAAVDGQLQHLAGAALVNREVDRDYAFRHALTEEVAYESLPFASRSALHDRVGDWLEQHESAGPDRILDLLAHHFGRGNDDAKKQHYLGRAGRAAQSRYANDAAVEYYRRALEVTPGPDSADLQQRLGVVLERRGEWAAAETTYGRALAVHEGNGDAAGQARIRTDLAEVARKQGRFDDAGQQLSRARVAFEALGDDVGIARVLHLTGTLASQQGRYPQARAAYEASLALRERQGDRPGAGALLSNLAVVAECVGDYDAARRLGERALQVREDIGDPAGICVSQNNLGMVALLQHDYADARRRVAESMRLAAEVGDLWMVAVGHHNLGNAGRGLQDHAEAGAHYRAALGAYEDHADRWSLALLVEDVALLALATDQPGEALELIGGADTLRVELAAPRAPSAAAELARWLEPARAELGVAADERLELGRLLDLAALTTGTRNVCHAVRARLSQG